MENETSSQVQIKDLIKKEYLKCAKDPIHFAKKYGYISHPVRGRILFQLYPFQENTLEAFQKNDFTIINKSRQLGISTLVAMYSLWIMLFNQNKTILVVATKQETAKNMVTKVKFMYDNLPSWLKGNKSPLEDNKLSLKLANESQIIATSAASDAGRSYAVSLLIMDEAAFIEGIDRIYTSIMPTLATGGGAIALSSPYGVGNWFHKTFLDAEIGRNKFSAITLPWYVHPERDEQWFENEKANMSPREIAQEYECSFLGSGNTVVDSGYLEFYEQTYIEEPVERRFLGGDFWIWRYPDLTKQYLVCADVARGDGSDYSAFHVIDTETCEQVAEYSSKIGTREYGNMLVSVAMEYNNALLVVENANIGWDVVNTILDKGYDKLYYSPRSYGDMSLDKYMDKLDSEQIVPGFTNSTKTRPLVISKMESYIRDKALIFHSKRLLEQLRVFIWHNGKAQAQNGYNDDLVMAMGIGLFIRDTALKFYAQSIDLTRNTISGFSKTDYGYAANSPKIDYPGNGNGFQNPYKINVGGNMEDLTWLLD